MIMSCSLSNLAICLSVSYSRDWWYLFGICITAHHTVYSYQIFPTISSPFLRAVSVRLISLPTIYSDNGSSKCFRLSRGCPSVQQGFTPFVNLKQVVIEMWSYPLSVIRWTSNVKCCCHCIFSHIDSETRWNLCVRNKRNLCIMAMCDLWTAEARFVELILNVPKVWITFDLLRALPVGFVDNRSETIWMRREVRRWFLQFLNICDYCYLSQVFPGRH